MKCRPSALSLENAFEELFFACLNAAFKELFEDMPEVDNESTSAKKSMEWCRNVGGDVEYSSRESEEVP